MLFLAGWWYQPDYIINELNVNSVITSPAHDEMLPINLSSAHEPYLLKGYAYSGGGRKVVRVEISLNDGESWRLCKVTHPSPCTKYGKYWCWNLWEVEADLVELLQAKEIVVRAWDFAMNTQPQKIVWNLMGMMNNCWYRVKVGACKHKDGGIALTFEHPILAGNLAGGWMAKKQIEEVTQPTPSKTVSTPILGNPNVRQIQMKEVRKHSKPESVWIVVHNKVYDCTKFVPDHPGGTDSILINGGLDSTEEFDAIHSDKAKAMLEEYYIGDLAVSASDNVKDSDSEEEEEEKEDGPAIVSPSGMSIALNPKLRQPFVLIEKEILSHDVRRYLAASSLCLFVSWKCVVPGLALKPVINLYSAVHMAG
jgi:nitrate reductase (NAD(P)H)